MRRGLLRDRVTFYRLVRTQTDSGSMRIDREKVWSCKAHAERFSNVTDKDKIDAKEQFYGSFGVLRVHNYPKIKEDQIVEYRGVMYQIILIVPRFSDNTLAINVTKLNE
jgi:hypothetical protein